MSRVGVLIFLAIVCKVLGMLCEGDISGAEGIRVEAKITRSCLLLTLSVSELGPQISVD